jgi:protein-L-isoaspartate(D-aspartate) O-methyltransferase
VEVVEMSHLDVERARFNMIEQQIRPWEVLDARVLEALHRIHREEFVPAAHRALAFVDTEVPLPHGQCMLAPKIEARMLQELMLTPTDVVLEVGAGSGHMAALLASLGRTVHTVERVAELEALARENLTRARVGNVRVHGGDGSKGLFALAPFDAIVLSGSVAEVPRVLLEQLRAGGRLVAIVGHPPVMQAVRFTRTAASGFERVELFDTVAPRLVGFEEPPRFRF